MISSQAVGSIVGMKSDEISEIARDYLQRQAVLEQETNNLKAGKLGGSTHTHKRQMNALEKAIGNEKEKFEKVCCFCLVSLKFKRICLMVVLPKLNRTCFYFEINSFFLFFLSSQVLISLFLDVL